MKLTLKLISEIYKDQSIETLKDVNASKKSIDSIEDLSTCKELRKLNLSSNELADDASIAGLKDLEQLTLLNLSHNKFKDFTGFQHFNTLNVLNVSHNKLVHMSPHITRVKQLKALILNNNELLEIENIEALHQLNTLVVSHNKIDTVPKLSSNAELTKFSAAHNQLTIVPDFSHNPLLKEIRLNDNKITEIPETLRKCNSIEVLDFGNNKLSDWKSIAALGSLVKLHNLNLKGNPIANKKDYIEKVLELVPSLRILDGERFDPKFLERKKKQRENVNLIEKKQRVKRIKLQKKKKELKSKGELLDTDVKMKEASKEPKPRKSIVAKVTKIKSKRPTETTEDEPALKKKKKSTDEKDSFFLKPEDNPIKEKKPVVKKKKSTIASESAPNKAAKETKAKDDTLPVSNAAPTPTPTPATPVVQSKAQTGIVGIVDKTKKAKKPNNKADDIIAALENESKEEKTDSGTGLDVGGWD
ncbi:MAG: hypothetical protein EXX96DRAFT_552266 [Benjaminiella poitrasii]|nr:MAG: hypothetical protein EXX96DRAFT_552266 [Benjaminiella poitrasii]